MLIDSDSLPSSTPQPWHLPAHSASVLAVKPFPSKSHIGNPLCPPTPRLFTSPISILELYPGLSQALYSLPSLIGVP